MPRRWSDKRREQPRSRSLEPQRPSPAVGDAHDESPRKTGNFGPDPRMEALDITGACPRSDTDVSDWATTEAREKGSGTPFAAATPSAHPPYDSHPVELALRMVTASAGLRGRRPLENAAVFVVLLALPPSQRPCARWGCPHPRSDAVSICDGAGAYRNAGCIHARCRLARPHRQVFCCIRRLPVASYDCMSHLSTACCAV